MLRGVMMIGLCLLGWMGGPGLGWRLGPAPAMAAELPLLYVREVPASMNATYMAVFTELENNGFVVVFEPNLGRNLAMFASRWGADYNRNHLEGIRSMVFCNGWYANRISNADPDLLALCPLHLTLVHKQGRTRVLFVRPSRVAAGSPAEPVALELEQDIIRAVEAGVRKLEAIPSGATPSRSQSGSAASAGVIPGTFPPQP